MEYIIFNHHNGLCLSSIDNVNFTKDLASAIKFDSYDEAHNVIDKLVSNKSRECVFAIGTLEVYVIYEDVPISVDMYNLYIQTSINEDSQSEIKLKMCPFCGNIGAVGLHIFTPSPIRGNCYYYVKCNNCKARGPMIPLDILKIATDTEYEIKLKAKEAWNIRVTQMR